jgi:hypothetical protein
VLQVPFSSVISFDLVLAKNALSFCTVIFPCYLFL